MPYPENGLTYKDAGVDIDAGEELVARIGPAAKATRRPGADADLGGFGGLFDLKAAGFKDPILVSGTDGVGTKLKLAIDTRRFDGIGQDLVAMCVNDIVVQGAEPLFFLDYYATGKLDVEAAAVTVGGIARACKEAGCALIGGETAEMRDCMPRATSISPVSRSARWERDAILPKLYTLKAGDVLIGVASSGVHSNGFSLVRKVVEKSRLELDAPSPFGGGELGRSVADADAAVCEGRTGRDEDRAASKAWPISLAAASPTTCRAACPKDSMRKWTWMPLRCCRCSSGWRRPRASRNARCCVPSIAASAWWRW